MPTTTALPLRERTWDEQAHPRARGRFVAKHSPEAGAVNLVAAQSDSAVQTRLGTSRTGTSLVEAFDSDGTVLGDTAYETDCDQVVVRLIFTNPAHRGRGVARATMRRLVAEHPDCSFDTESFSGPTAKRLWREVIAEAAEHPDSDTVDCTLDDGRCDWCCRVLDDDTDLDICEVCEPLFDEHADGAHDPSEPSAEQPEGCWHCHTEGALP